jgi:hypothetical protein
LYMTSIRTFPSSLSVIANRLRSSNFRPRIAYQIHVVLRF